MAIYIIIFALLFTSSLLEVGGLKKNQATWLFYAMVGVIVLFVGLRYHTGGDWYLYNKIFNYSLSPNPEHTEYGYLLLNKFFKLTFNNYYILQFAVTLFIGISFYKFYKKHSQYPIVSFSLMVWIFFYTILMSQVRQSIAIAIILYSTQYIFDRKLWHFLCMIIVACFFHVSAVAAIPLYNVPQAEIIHLDGKSSEISINRFLMIRRGTNLYYQKTQNRFMKLVCRGVFFLMIYSRLNYF
jgi:hypothetical protein